MHAMHPAVAVHLAPALFPRDLLLFPASSPLLPGSRLPVVLCFFFFFYVFTFNGWFEIFRP
ncbi:hypothetical protein BDDG_12159 [Blastomyces dermatitidis ATCC 18188]|uniref:Uncharacterized protein n=1 Tax=Ajellomyces dermatitidis (strain ATCC 18188 / CBS 674.68) TaxID=653446 RepID=A0A0J9HEL4_AJEDA|nr:hypothetical protein BDDG_12159 [Blastomyces dermatitidis ATCC 18188]